jgi:Uma2 family endonuclease
MTVVNGPIPLSEQQHIVLDDVSWEFYERTLREIGNRAVRVTYDDGSMEIMSPLPKHERCGGWIGRLIELMCLERDIHVESLGSTTFRSALKKKGLEPDECFYVEHAAQAREMEDEFDATIHPPPDLAIEIDITHRSIPRDPIYAALGVKELWRFEAKGLKILHLSATGKYVVRERSIAFPFLPMQDFSRFVLRMRDKDQLKVLREFRQWVRSLPAQSR